ncbi:hypothetical protein OsJ_35737 [Oryza sativa Japonica Group]|uniref:Uncharacterized protein n=2 Tax=Oryza sativa subsp. japonica TaxID=39947 RepID=A0A8J8XTF2_ORYSJ|nr:expressed protein [Oryza sativa Japonica Group]EEE53023.1 hypothetical protein OsJ_35737 [Oryza sativa Japonica Group]
MELGGAAWRSSMSPAQTQPLISLLTSPPSASTAPGSGNLRGCSSASNIRHASSSGHIAKMKALFKSKPGTRKCQMEGKRVLVELGTLLLSCMPLFDPPRHESA